MMSTGLTEVDAYHKRMLLQLAAIVARGSHNRCELEALDVAGRQSLLTMQVSAAGLPCC